MSRRPTITDESAAYPPYQSRPSVAGTEISSSSAARAPYRAGSAVGAQGGQGGQEENRFLQAAQEIELTKEDKQEGYDATLLNLPERNTVAAPPAADALARASSPPAVVASTLPYASRARDDSTDTKRRSTGDGAAKKGVRHHASSAKADHHRSRSTGGAGEKGARGSGRGASKRSRKKQLKWWQKPLALVALLALLLVVGLAVGLGVGLTQGNKSKSGDTGKGATSAAPSLSNSMPGGVQPSQSGASNGDGVAVSASSTANDVTAAMVQPTASASQPAPPDIVRPAAARGSVLAVVARRQAVRWA